MDPLLVGDLCQQVDFWLGTLKEGVEAGLDGDQLLRKIAEARKKLSRLSEKATAEIKGSSNPDEIAAANVASNQIANFGG